MPRLIPSYFIVLRQDTEPQIAPSSQTRAPHEDFSYRRAKVIFLAVPFNYRSSSCLSSFDGFQLVVSLKQKWLISCRGRRAPRLVLYYTFLNCFLKDFQCWDRLLFTHGRLTFNKRESDTPSVHKLVSTGQSLTWQPPHCAERMLGQPKKSGCDWSKLHTW